jgi:acyl-CoA-binding protein
MAKKAVFTGLVAAAATPDAPPADDERFRQAQDWVTSVAVPRQLLSSDAVLRLYGAFKQATSGAAPLRGPSRWDLRARAKWEAWSAMRPLEAEVRSAGGTSGWHRPAP